MTDRIITREISAHHAWQGPESEAPAMPTAMRHAPTITTANASDTPALCNDGPQLAALAEEIDMAECRAFSAGYEAALEAESNIKKINIAPTGDLISREAATKIASDTAFERDHAGDFVSKMQGATAAVIANRIRALPAQGQPAAPAVKVKPLVWEGFTSGCYRIEVKEGGIARLLYYSAAIFDDEEPEHILGGYLSLVSMNDLKAAAQADYEARILAALDGAE